MDAKTAVLLGALFLFWLLLLFLIFVGAGAPKASKLLLFQVWLLVSLVLGYLFLVKVYKWNPNPLKVELARRLTGDRTIYLGDIVPGLYDLDRIQRIDTDGADERIKEEWVALYQYDVHHNPEQKRIQDQFKGPFGAAIYDYDDCRPPAILSFELVPVSYDYLGQDQIQVEVSNIISYSDPLSGRQDRPEVIVKGWTGGSVTDLNIFRQVGQPLDCLLRQEWQAKNPGEAFPNPFLYQNIGSFRANYLIKRSGATVSVIDRAPFERSQITIRRDYRPENGTYFHLGTQVLLDPVEYSLTFGPGTPESIPQVYYPEKAVLAFYLKLGKDARNLEEARGYLSPRAQDAYNIKTDSFGLAMSRKNLARVLVWEIRYQPDADAERLHREREVTVTVVGVDEKGNIDYAHPCQVTWGVTGVANSGALPYGCEWRLDWYRSTCPASR